MKGTPRLPWSHPTHLMPWSCYFGVSSNKIFQLSVSLGFFFFCKEMNFKINFLQAANGRVAGWWLAFPHSKKVMDLIPSYNGRFWVGSFAFFMSVWAPVSPTIQKHRGQVDQQRHWDRSGGGLFGLLSGLKILLYNFLYNVKVYSKNLINKNKLKLVSALTE